MRRFFLFTCLTGATGLGRRPIRTKPPPVAVTRPMLLAASILLWLVLTVSADAQSLRSVCGRVLDAHDSAPVSGAVVTIDGTAWEAATDQDGWFAFYDLPPGDYRMAVSAEGYYCKRGVESEVSVLGSAMIVVHLRRRLTTVEPINVRAVREIVSSESMVVLDRRQIDDSRAHDLSEVLGEVPGVQVESDGTGRGSNVCIRGSSSEQVLVLVDGHRLNPAGGGQADLSSIPLEMIERVEIYKGSASAQFGPDAMAGAINIITQSSAASAMSAGFDQNISSWHGRRSAFSVRSLGDNEGLSLNASITTERAARDFPFAYSVAPTDTVIEGRRLNNRSHSDNYFLSGRMGWGSETELTASLQVYESSQGLPGAAREQNPFAKRTDDRLLLTSNLRHHLGRDIYLAARLGWSRLDQDLVDLESSSADRYHVAHSDRTFTEGLTLKWESAEAWSVQLGADGSQQRLEHHDYLIPRRSTGITERSTWSGHAEIRRSVGLPSGLWFRQLMIDGVIRYDDATTTPHDTIPAYPWDPARQAVTVARWTPRTGASLSSDGALKTTVRFSHGSSFRLPSINALFWEGDARSTGNPDLRPEVMLATNWGGSVRYEAGRHRFEAGLTWFHRRVDDLVRWVQTGPDGIWKPVNLGSARITGREDFVRLSLWDQRVVLDYQNTLTDARNRVPGPNSYDKHLTHTPRYSTRVALAINSGPVRVQYATRLVGRRWATEANTKWYDGQRLDDLDLSVTVPISSSWKLSGDVSIKNLLDEDYVIITHHPAPGRNWRAGLGVVFNPTNRKQ